MRIIDEILDPTASTNIMGLLTPEDRLMSLFQGLTQAGMHMAQPGLGRGQALAMGLGGFGQGVAQGNQQALQQRLFLEKLMEQKQLKDARERYLEANPQHAALARAVGPEAFKTLLDRSIPKMAETPFGFQRGNDGTVSAMPGAFDTMSALEAQKTAARTEAERKAQNAVPLTTETADYKGRVAGAEAAARGQVELTNAEPLATRRERGQIAGQLSQVRTDNGMMPGLQAVEMAKQAAQAPGQGYARENGLRDEFTKLTGDFRVVQDAYNKIGEAAKTPSGASDMSLLYSYVKLLDPGSVVRESEFATAAASGSFGERVQGAVNRVISGERLPETLRKDFLDQAKGIYTAQKRGYDNVTDQYTELAKRYGLKPENVVTRFDMPSPAANNGSSAQPDPLSQARDAISRGAPRDEVIRRLKAAGIDASGL
jgi:hypothetical protein